MQIHKIIGINASRSINSMLKIKVDYIKNIPSLEKSLFNFSKERKLTEAEEILNIQPANWGIFPEYFE